MLLDCLILYGDYWGVPLGMAVVFLACRGNCWHWFLMPSQPPVWFPGTAPSFPGSHYCTVRKWSCRVPKVGSQWCHGCWKSTGWLPNLSLSIFTSTLRLSSLHLTFKLNAAVVGGACFKCKSWHWPLSSVGIRWYLISSCRSGSAVLSLHNQLLQDQTLVPL